MSEQRTKVTQETINDLKIETFDIYQSFGRKLVEVTEQRQKTAELEKELHELQKQIQAKELAVSNETEILAKLKEIEDADQSNIQ